MAAVAHWRIRSTFVNAGVHFGTVNRSSVAIDVQAGARDRWICGYLHKIMQPLELR